MRLPARNAEPRASLLHGCLLIALGLPAGVSAQASGQPQGDQSGQPAAAVQLPSVVASATRIPADALVVPAAIDVVEADAIHRARPAIDLSESLDRIPGVVARNRQNDAQDLQISIRGFGARATFGVRGVRLYTDGIPATMPDGQGQVSHFPIASAERIEVLRGPFSALYGNASGGVISLFTASAPAEPTLSAGLVLGGYGLQQSSLSFQTPWGDGNDGSFVGDFADVRSDGYRRHSRSHRRSGQAVLKGVAGTGTRYTVLVNGLDLEADDPQGLTAGQLRGDRRAASDGALAFDTRKTVRQGQAGARIEQALGESQTLRLTAHAGSRKTTQMLSVPVIVQRKNPMHGGGAIDLDRDYSGADLRWQWASSLLERPFSLTTGLEHQVSEERRRGFENFIGDRIGVVGKLRRDQDDRVTARDVYAQAEWAPADRWRINLGARRSQVRFNSRDHYITADNPDDSGSLEYARTSPVAGVLFRATPWLSVYANAGAGFETPTLSELAYRDDDRSGLNDGLEPARSRNIEAGVRARRDGWEWSGAVFQSRTRDELVVVANQGGRSVYGNAGVSRRRGVELAGTVEFAPQWHLSGAYTFLDAEYLTDFAACGTPPCGDDSLIIQAGRRIPGLARNTAWSELRWSPLASTDVMLEGQFTDRIAVDDANSEYAPAAARFDLAAEHRIQRDGLEWRGFARLNNVFDRDIIGSVIVNDGNGRYYEPAPGRHWQVGVSASRSF
ncbi:TonB-dependent receptor [Lysobacter sp. H21R4]|uniref:TonB-dependent receptor family protein n=1 Tax=Lysobacter sp. H21R4 TaxID=2781021 RepID=UPI001887FF88|nr:TonB-dependent receptor [Lysobacter sp. H21R4]QOY61722.1 TonB-dependent receptor [Lysobacter sp. H21R4]